MAQRKYLVIGDLRGGRNGADPPLSLPDDMCVEAMNCDWFEGTLGHKRPGAVAVSTAPGGSGSAFASKLSSLFVSSYEYADYMTAVDGSSPAIVNYYDTGTAAWKAINDGDTIAGSPHAVNAVTFNNRTYVTFDSSVDRLHFWSDDASINDNKFYRVGIPAPTAAPSVANTGSGSYTATVRYYKVAWIYKVGTDIKNRSEASAVATFTPSGSGTAARVTMPTLPSGELISHWELYGSSDGNIYQLLSTTSAGTTTYDDSTAPASYDGDYIPLVGANTVPGSWKYIASNGSRLIGAGNWEGGNQSRVWFTPVYGASDIGDAERVPTSNYIDLDAYDGDAITGIVGSFMGNTVVFKSQAIWRLVATGEDVTPFAAVCLTKAMGCVAPKSLVVGEDENGSPAIYFMSERGPARISTSGIEYCGRDVEDLTANLNRSATVPCHAVWYPDKHQVWFHIAVGTDSYPTERMVLDTHQCRRGLGGVRKGWSRQTGPSCTTRCSLMFGPTLAAGARLNTQPWVGSSVTNSLLLRCDDTSAENDNGTPFQAYVKTKPYALGGLGFNCAVSQSHLTAKASDDVTITQTLDRDYGAEVRLSSCSLTPASVETRVQRQFDASDLAGAGVVQFQLGDYVAVSNAWTLDALMVPYAQQEER